LSFEPSAPASSYCSSSTVSATRFPFESILRQRPGRYLWLCHVRTLSALRLARGFCVGILTGSVQDEPVLYPTPLLGYRNRNGGKAIRKSLYPAQEKPDVSNCVEMDAPKWAGSGRECAGRSVRCPRRVTRACSRTSV
jgi:hypothetical protein